MKKIIISVGLVLLIAIAVVAFIYRSSSSSKKTTIDNRPSFAKGDINKDGKVDVMDSEIIRNNLGCHSGILACWSRLVGKTVEGDNPIYTSDLDLNGDGKIDDADMVLAK